MALPPAGRALGPVLAPVLALVLGTGLLAGCADDTADAPATPRPTPIGRLDTTGMAIPRIGFCDLVPDQAVQDALDERVTDHQEWDNGEPPVGAIGGASERAHELGCAWRARSGASARAWVFARPVTADFARQVVRQGRARPGCRAPKAAGAFGRPSILQECTLPGGDLRVRRAGLFGDSWLSCEVVEPDGRREAVRERADAWCVQVANALDTARS